MGVSDSSGNSLTDCIFDDFDKEERLIVSSHLKNVFVEINITNTVALVLSVKKYLL